MLTLEQMKKLLDDPSIPDDQVLEIRDQLYALSEIIFEKWQQDKAAGKLPNQKAAKNKVQGSIKDSITTGR